MELRNDILPAAELTAATRGEVLAAEERDITSQLLPAEYSDDPRVEFTVDVNPLDQVSPVRAWDAGSAFLGVDEGERRFAETIPNSAVLPFGEYDYLRRAGRTDDDSVLSATERRRRQVANAILLRLSQLRTEALLTGELVINENGVRQNVDFGRDPSLTATSGVSWDDAGANPLEDIESYVEAFADVNGVEPTTAVIGRRAFSALTRNPNVIGAFAQGVQVNLDSINAWLEGEGFPTFVINRDRGVLSPESLVFAIPGSDRLGSTVWAPTKEVQTRDYGLDEADFPGIAVGIYTKNDPAVELIHGVANYLPVLKNANFSMAATVIH